MTKPNLYYIPGWRASFFGVTSSVTCNKVVIGGDGYENCRSTINKYTKTSLQGLLSHYRKGHCLLIGHQLLIPAMVYHPKSQMCDKTDASSILALLFAEVGGIPINAPQNPRLLFALAQLCGGDGRMSVVKHVNSLNRMAYAALLRYCGQHDFATGPFRIRGALVRDVDKILAEFRDEINLILARDQVK